MRVILFLEAVDPEERNLRLARINRVANRARSAVGILRQDKNLSPSRKNILRRYYLSKWMRGKALVRAYRVGEPKWSKSNYRTIAHSHRTTMRSPS